MRNDVGDARMERRGLGQHRRRRKPIQRLQGAINMRGGAHDLDLPMLKMLNHVALFSFSSWSR